MCVLPSILISYQESEDEESLEHIKNIELPFQNEGLRTELIIHKKIFNNKFI